jgi:hypothetical protein
VAVQLIELQKVRQRYTLVPSERYNVYVVYDTLLEQPIGSTLYSIDRARCFVHKLNVIQTTFEQPVVSS